MSKPVVITLTVEAAKLYGMINPKQVDIDSCCLLSDNNSGYSPDKTLENFTSFVFLNELVSWDGLTKDSGYTISIDSIVYKPKPDSVNFFDSTTIKGSGGSSGIVKAKVKDDKSLIGKTYIYSINFSVYKSNNDFKSFSIDPKLQINP